jgi:hypothetical protein
MEAAGMLQQSPGSGVINDAEVERIASVPGKARRIRHLES